MRNPEGRGSRALKALATASTAAMLTVGSSPALHFDMSRVAPSAPLAVPPRSIEIPGGPVVIDRRRNGRRVDLALGGKLPVDGADGVVRPIWDVPPSNGVTGSHADRGCDVDNKVNGGAGGVNGRRVAAEWGGPEKGDVDVRDVVLDSVIERFGRQEVTRSNIRQLADLVRTTLIEELRAMGRGWSVRKLRNMSSKDVDLSRFGIEKYGPSKTDKRKGWHKPDDTLCLEFSSAGHVAYELIREFLGEAAKEGFGGREGFCEDALRYDEDAIDEGFECTMANAYKMELEAEEEDIINEQWARVIRSEEKLIALVEWMDPIPLPKGSFDWKYRVFDAHAWNAGVDEVGDLDGQEWVFSALTDGDGDDSKAFNIRSLREAYPEAYDPRHKDNLGDTYERGLEKKYAAELEKGAADWIGLTADRERDLMHRYPEAFFRTSLDEQKKLALRGKERNGRGWVAVGIDEARDYWLQVEAERAAEVCNDWTDLYGEEPAWEEFTG